MKDGVIVDPTVITSWGWNVCRCGVCGYTAQCTPQDDFYRRGEEKFLRCENCVYVEGDGRAN